MMHKTVRWALLCGGLLVSAAVAAAPPIVKRPPLNKLGHELAKSMPLQDIPAADQVPLPAYPGALFERVEPNAHPNKGTLVSLVLVSNDPPAKVRTWYAKHLNGMKYFADMKAFAPVGFKDTFPALFTTRHVTIHATTPARLNPGLYALPHVKTEITLDYFAK